MKILLTNDDSIHAPGIHALYNEAKKYGEVTLVAPSREMSAIGHAITISDSLRIEEYERFGIQGFAVTGTPADCVKMAIKEVMKVPPDIVISGVNQGSNTGFNVIYSGTVSGASEAAILGFPAIAVSLDSYHLKEFQYAAEIALKTAVQLIKSPLPKFSLLNINVPSLPNDQINGIRVGKQGRYRYDEVFDRREDPRGRVYYWMGAERLKLIEADDIDETLLRKGYVVMTPLHLDLTDTKSIQHIQSLIKSIGE